MGSGGGTRDGSESRTRFSVRPAQVVGAILIVGLVGSLLAFAFVTEDDEVEETTPTTIPVPGDPLVLDAALRPSDPGAGSFVLSLPAEWVAVEPTAQGLDEFVEERATEPGAGPVTQLVERLRPAILGGEVTELGPVPFAPDEREREAAAVAVPTDGSGYVLVSTVPARGASVEEVEAAVRGELGTPDAVTYDDELVGGLEGFAVTIAGGSADAPADVVHHLTVTNDLLFVVTSTGSAPTDLHLAVTFDVPAPAGDRVETVSLHPDYPDATAAIGVPGTWVTPSLEPAAYAEYVDEVASNGEDGLARLLESLEPGIEAASEAEADGTAGAVAPRFVVAEPTGRAYVMVSSGDVGSATLEQVRAAFTESNVDAELEESDDALAGLPGLVATSTDEQGVVITTSLVLAGPILVTVVAAGEGTDAIVADLVIDGIPPVPDVPVSTTSAPAQPEAPVPTSVVTPPTPPVTQTPPQTAPPATQQVVRIPIGPTGARTLSFVFPDDWVQVPVDPEGFGVFKAEQAVAGRAALTALLDAIEPFLIFELPDLPFDLGIELPQAAFIGAAEDASGFVGVQLSAAEGRTAQQIALAAVAAADEQDRDLTSEPIVLGGERAFRLTESRDGRVFEQDIIVIDDIAVTLLHDPDLPAEMTDSMRIE